MCIPCTRIYKTKEMKIIIVKIHVVNTLHFKDLQQFVQLVHAM